MDPILAAQPGQPEATMQADPIGENMPLGDDKDPARERAEAVTRAFFKEFKQARKFDKAIRQQIAKDRSYASGNAQLSWAVSTNLIGSIIDILVAVLYARDPDVSVRKTPQTDSSPDPATGMQPVNQEQRDAELFARTMELVISKLWRKARMKKRMRRIVRSVLSTGQGWLKVLPESYVEPDPIAQSEYNTLKDNLRQFEAIRAALAAGQTLTGVTASPDDLQVLQDQMERQAQALADKLEVTVCEAITVDVVKPEDLQISTDVELLEDHLDADWNAHLIYIPLDKLKARFPTLTDADLQTVEKFYKKPPINANDGAVNNPKDGLEAVENMLVPTNSDGEEYTNTPQDEESVAFGCVVEQWNHVDNHVHTYLRGVKVPVKEPYQTKWATSRFFPFFYFSVYEVDGSRAPQSLASRLAKLQDEYNCTRSNFRVARERATPATLFDAGVIDDAQAKNITKNARSEFIAVKLPGDGSVKVGDLFAEKPIEKIDPRLYDTAPIVADKERIAGVQEAQQGSVNVEKTATEAEIEQAGFSARTTASRDSIETTLNELAQYTAEIAIQMVSVKTAQRMAGPFAFWPVGMSREDILTMVEVEISAGTTGKPRNRGDREAWATVMPMIKEVQMQIAQLQLTPEGIPLVNALKALVKETMLRMGDDTDPERFFPQMPILPMAPPAVPGDPNAGAAPGSPTPPPSGASGAPGAAPAPEPPLNNAPPPVGV